MKYKLLKELPFMEAGEVFGKGCWVGGGWGVDRGTTNYEGGGSSHNGIAVFDEYASAILDSIIENKAWIEHMPETSSERLRLYEDGRITREDYLRAI